MKQHDSPAVNLSGLGLIQGQRRSKLTRQPAQNHSIHLSSIYKALEQVVFSAGKRNFWIILKYVIAESFVGGPFAPQKCLRAYCRVRQRRYVNRRMMKRRTSVCPPQLSCPRRRTAVTSDSSRTFGDRK